MYESNLTIEQLKSCQTLSASVRCYLKGDKRCYKCAKIKSLFLYFNGRKLLWARCEGCSKKLLKQPAIRLSDKDEIVYFLFIKNIIR